MPPKLDLQDNKQEAGKNEQASEQTAGQAKRTSLWQGIKNFWNNKGVFGKIGIVTTGILAVALLTTFALFTVGSSLYLAAAMVASGVAAVRIGVAVAEAPEAHTIQENHKKNAAAKLDASIDKKIENSVAKQVEAKLANTGLAKNAESNAEQVKVTSKEADVKSFAAGIKQGPEGSKVAALEAQRENQAQQGKFHG